MLSNVTFTILRFRRRPAETHWHSAFWPSSPSFCSHLRFMLFASQRCWIRTSVMTENSPNWPAGDSPTPLWIVGIQLNYTAVTDGGIRLFNQDVEMSPMRRSRAHQSSWKSLLGSTLKWWMKTSWTSFAVTAAHASSLFLKENKKFSFFCKIKSWKKKLSVFNRTVFQELSSL